MDNLIFCDFNMYKFCCISYNNFQLLLYVFQNDYFKDFYVYCFSLDPEQKEELITVIEKLLADKSTLVVGSTVMAFEEVFIQLKYFSIFVYVIIKIIYGLLLFVIFNTTLKFVYKYLGLSRKN